MGHGILGYLPGGKAASVSLYAVRTHVNVCSLRWTNTMEFHDPSFGKLLALSHDLGVIRATLTCLCYRHDHP